METEMEEEAMDKYAEYIKSIRAPEDFKTTGVTKTIYLDIIEKAVEAYSKSELEFRTTSYASKICEDIQAYSRITSAIAILIANGRKTEYLDIWKRMMDICCRDISRITEGAMPDFSVKEIMLAYKAMSSHIEIEKKQQWLNALKMVEPSKNFNFTLDKVGEERLHNINIYNMVGEYLRESEGLTDTKEYFDKHWPVQFKKFDVNAMYIDPEAPMLYDLTTRAQIELMLGFGYNGEYLNKLDSLLKQGAINMLFTQSSAFEFPYGGRSNQFQFNEALIAACAEYEAVRYKKLGDLKMAGIFKRSAHLAVKAILRWINDVKPPRHIKNFYPIESKYGTESYGYYDKYMVTLGNFIYIAYIFADDTIEEVPCPAEIGGYIYETSEIFHKVFANCAGNSIEIDMKANNKYDSTGIGRYHKRGIPTELGLSTPFASNPHYTLKDTVVKKDISICPGWEDKEGNIHYLSELSDGLEYTVTVIKEELDKVIFTIKYIGDAFKGCKGIKELYTIDGEGIKITAELIEPEKNIIYYSIPLFVTNGKDNSILNYGDSQALVKMGEYLYEINTNGQLTIDRNTYGNRNGEYYRAQLKQNDTGIELKLNLH
jgi:hypothetical protein